MAVKKQNQVHPPLPKKECVDAQGNHRRGAYFKTGNTTVLLARGLTSNAIKVIGNTLENICEELGVKLEGHIIDAPVKLK